MIKRSKLVPVMVTFDLPEPLTSQGQRTTTTVAPQALLLMNSQHVRRYANGIRQSERPRPQTRLSMPTDELSVDLQRTKSSAPPRPS